MADRDPAVVDLIAARPDAVEAVRADARQGAHYVAKNMAWPWSSYVVDAAELGGPDVLVFGGSSFDDDPFPQFRGVAILGALLAAQPGSTEVLRQSESIGATGEAGHSDRS